jgi:allophanate hydrolase subunit 1
VKERERLDALRQFVEDNPFASKRDISEANLAFLVKYAEEHIKLKKEVAQLRDTNRELEAQIYRITMVIMARKERTVRQRYHDIQTILGVDTFV